MPIPRVARIAVGNATRVVKGTSQSSNLLGLLGLAKTLKKNHLPTMRSRSKHGTVRD